MSIIEHICSVAHRKLFLLVSFQPPNLFQHFYTQFIPCPHHFLPYV